MIELMVVAVTLGWFVFPWSFGLFGKSKDKDLYGQWRDEVRRITADTQGVIDRFRRLESQDLPSLDQMRLLHGQFQPLGDQITSLAGQSFKLKGELAKEEEVLREELEAVKADFDFFFGELSATLQTTEELVSFQGQIEDMAERLTKLEPSQQELARSVPSVKNTGELSVLEERFSQLRNALPREVELPEFDLPDELALKRERFNLKLAEWHRKLDVVEKSFSKRLARLEASESQAEHESKLRKVHSWIDAVDAKVKRLSGRLTEIEALFSEDDVGVGTLTSLEKELGKLGEEIQDLAPPTSTLKGEQQAQVSMQQRIRDIDYLKKQFDRTSHSLFQSIDEQLADYRTRLLEQMFRRSHQLTFTRVNYTLGLRNELLLKGWLQQEDLTNAPLKVQKKFLVLTKGSVEDLLAVSQALFELMLQFTRYERETNEVSYRASLKWLVSQEKARKA